MEDTPLQTKYDAFGNTRTPEPHQNSPESNPGLVYQPANIPSSPGPITPGQTIASLTFQSGYSLRRIRITMNPADDPLQPAGTIALIDEDGNIIWSVGDTSNPTVPATMYVSAIGNETAFAVVGLPGPNRTVPLVSIYDQDTGSIGPALYIQDDGTGSTAEFRANGGWPLRLDQTFTTATHFKLMQIMENFVQFWTSDGTTPNGNLTGNQGDVCFGGPGGQPFWCGGGTTWTAM